MAEDKFTEKEEFFCREYLVNLNATQAYKRAGYAASNDNIAGVEGHKLLRKPKIKSFIAKLKKERADRLEVDAGFVLQRFLDISNRCMQAEPVMTFDGEQWVESGEYKFDSTGANKATEMMGKHIGFFEEDNKQGAMLPIFKTVVKILPSDAPIATSEKDVIL